MRRDNILSAAFMVFTEKGFEASTTLEIVRRARTSKRALYETFASKEEILVALIAGGAQRMKVSPDLPPPGSRAEFLATLRGFGETFLNVYLHPHRMALYRLAITEVGRGGGTVARELEAGGRLPVVNSVSRYFGKAAEQGLLAREDVGRLTHVFFSVLIGSSPLQLLLGNEPPITAESVKAKSTAAVSVIERLVGDRLPPRTSARR